MKIIKGNLVFQEDMEKCRKEVEPILKELYKKYGSVVYDIVYEIREEIQTKGMSTNQRALRSLKLGRRKGGFS
jgi:uncharacterized pyridoxamine 5'-phosphate oxidase family protein